MTLQKIKLNLSKLSLGNPKLFFLPFALFIVSLIVLSVVYENLQTTVQLNKRIQNELAKLKSVDQYKKNKDLETTIAAIEKTFQQTIPTYEKILDARGEKRDTSQYEKSFAEILSFLSKRNYATVAASLVALNLKIDQDGSKAVASNDVGNTSNLTVNNTAPGSGYSRQKVHTDFGDFIVDVIAADLGSTRIIVDSASDSDCANDCPVLSLGDYVGRSGAFAGINGSYFCPAEYPSCAGKTNSFDTLLMNKNKHYINSDNNVYSTVPAVIFQGGSVRYVGQSLEWGRDTGVDGVLANQPLLVSGGNVVFGGDDDVKRAGAGSRSFVGSTGSTVYIGVVHGVNVAQMARVLKTMGIQNALNLDSGGSTALWSGGYRVGPGRAIPNALLFVRK